MVKNKLSLLAKILSFRYAIDQCDSEIFLIIMILFFQTYKNNNFYQGTLPPVLKVTFPSLCCKRIMKVRFLRKHENFQTRSSLRNASGIKTNRKAEKVRFNKALAIHKDLWNKVGLPHTLICKSTKSFA
jgi:hypothetical protein